MATHREIVEHQKQHHPLVPTEGFATLEAYCLYLVHLKAYEEATARAAGKVVLDCGCNVGYGVAHMSATAKTARGVDVSARAIAEAKERYPAHTFDVVDGESLPFEADSFDLVTSFQVIEHLGDPDQYLGEIRRVLRADGIAMFTTPNRQIRVPDGMKPWYQFHVQEFTSDELEAVLRPHFESVSVLGMQGGGMVYQTELRRSLRARRRHKLWRGRRPSFRALLPPRLRSLGRGQSAQLPSAMLEALSTRELEYRPERPETSIDLMAICS